MIHILGFLETVHSTGICAWECSAPRVVEVMLICNTQMYAWTLDLGVQSCASARVLHLFVLYTTLHCKIHCNSTFLNYIYFLLQYICICSDHRFTVAVALKPPFKYYFVDSINIYLIFFNLSNHFFLPTINTRREIFPDEYGFKKNLLTILDDVVMKAMIFL